MLVIISDLHLTDGTSTASIHPGTLHVFAQRLSEMAERASWRADGRYLPVDGIDLVLLGDVLDVLRSSRWLEAGVRPWDDVHSPEVVETVSTIVDGILMHNEQPLAMLRALADDGAIQVPAGDSRGQPLYQSEAHVVPVRTHYMVGNCDWHLHIASPQYDLLRQHVAHHLGLANRIDVPFPHDPQECDELLSVQRRHRVLARHGDVFDPLNFEGDRDGSSLGDVIVVQLVNRFAREIEQQIGDGLPEATLAALGEIDNIRPILLAPVWLDGLLQRTCACLATRKRVKRIWDDLVDELLALPFVRQRDGWSPFDMIDGLAAALKFSQRLSIGWSSRISAWMQELRGARSQSYYQHALAEPDFRNRRARHIVYGHTHEAESVPLDASYADNFVLNQMYFNAGTWRRVHRQTQLAPGEHEFIPMETMNYLSLFAGDERGGCPYEAWSGMLGVDALDGSVYRLDAGHQNTARGATPAMRLTGPHFAPRQAGVRTSSPRYVG
jgi:hypothetical protein